MEHQDPLLVDILQVEEQEMKVELEELEVVEVHY
jgi:hypothetical protein